MFLEITKWIIVFTVILFALVCLTDSTSASEKTCRSPTIKHQFDRLNGYPEGRKGYVVDHICALANGGLDVIENMQYQTIAEGHAKDRIENTPMGRVFCDDKNSLPYRTVFNCK